MVANVLLNLIENVNTWDKLEKKIAELPSEQQRGAAFEEFCHAFFLLDPVFQFKEVYRQNDIPPSVRERLGYPGIQDIGIDGIGINDDGKIYAWQAKFRSDRKTTPTLRELSTFFTVSDKADWRITISNANKLPPAIDDRVRQSRILADRFDALEPDFFDRLADYLKSRRLTPPAKKSPHITQKEAIAAAVSHYKNNNRGQLILPCGAGKTLASIWISEKLGGKNILIMLPSLSLLRQTLREWADNSSKTFRYLCVCSDTTVDLGNDAPIEKISDMDVPVTTEAEAIGEFLRGTDSKTSIIFSTYQSSKVLAEAINKSGAKFDIGIFDEAHRTAGTKVGAWGIALDDANISINKRIFMTATPKIYAPHITKKAKEEDVLICSMNDTEIYGKPFYEIGFADAVKRGHITDYKVIVICVTDAEVKKIIEQGGRVITDQEHEWDAKALAKRIALVKGIRAYDLRKAFTFHGKVASAKSFTDTSKPYGIDKIFNLVEPEKEKQNNLGFFHVNGTMPSGERSNILKEFESVDIGIMSNARCLVEGVNIPAVDTVAFIDPKRSLIDIVQATGRAMRKADWKENGYIFIPVILAENSEPEEIIKSSDFSTVWEVLQAMIDQDQRMEGIVSKMRILQGKGEQGSKAWKDAMNEYAEKIEFYDLPIKIEKNRFIEKLNTRIIEIIGRNWDFWYGLTLKYKDEFSDPNVEYYYKTPDGFPLGKWQSRQRVIYNKDKLSTDRIKQLEKIGFIWDPLEEQFEKGFQETLNYKESKGNPNAPHSYTTSGGFRLGAWQNTQRVRYKINKLSLDRINRFEVIGFIWNVMNYKRNNLGWDHWHELTMKYKNKFGDVNVPANCITEEGYKLGKWLCDQRNKYKKGKLSTDRINILKKIGFKWEIQEKQRQEQFEKGFQETLDYKDKIGNPNVPSDYITENGYRLGRWQGHQRDNYRKGELSSEKIERLEEIDFKWNIINYKQNNLGWDKWYELTIRHKDLFQNANANLRYITPEGYQLGKWQSHQRNNYKKGELSPDRIKRLEEIGFIWDPFEKQFEKGVNETLIYKDKTGHSIAPNKYRTKDGFRLGFWQRYQANCYKKGKLSSDRIKRLEEIGFKWGKQTKDSV